MNPFERVSLALTVMRQLQHVAMRETEALRQMKLDPLADLQAEKAALAAAYEREVRALRAKPEIFASLDQSVRESFAQASRELQTTLAANMRALEAARQVVDGVVRTLSQSMGSVQRRPNYAPSGQAGEPAMAVPVALNREI
jgi:hypothetical protein